MGTEEDGGGLKGCCIYARDVMGREASPRSHGERVVFYGL